MQIILVDSTFEEFVDKDLIPVNVKYLHFPNFSFQDKLSKGIKLVSTEYCVFCADDDFILPRAIDACLSFLNENRDYSSCQGNFISFRNDNGKLIFYPIYTETIGCDINSEAGEERMVDLLRNYHQMVYTVHKTENLKWLFNNEMVDRISNYILMELLFGIIAIIDGKHKVLPILFGIREDLPTTSGGYRDGLDVIVREDRYKNEYLLFINIVSEYLTLKRNMSIDVARELVEEVMVQHMKWLKSYLNSQSQKPTKVRLFMIQVRMKLEGYLSSILTRIYSIDCVFMSTFRMQSRGYPLNSSRNRFELKKIVSLLKKHHKAI